MTTLRKLLLCAAVVFGGVAFAQRPAQPPKDAPKQDAPKQDDLTARLMAFDKDKDGKLTKDELTDERLARLFDAIDADKDGKLTADEIKAFAAKQEQPPGGGRGGRGGPGGPGGGPGGDGFPGGPGGRGGFTPPKPGTVLAPFMVEQLKLTDDQKKKLEELQKDVDKQLDKLLTDDQKKTMKEMSERGPGGGGRGGPGGPGGGGPGGPGGGGRGGPGGGGRGPGGDR